MRQKYDDGLDRCAANYEALTPLDFIVRAADVYGERLAIVYGDVRRTWKDTYNRSRRLAGALAKIGVKQGDTVATLLPNIPEAIEAHFGVPMSGAVLNTLNTRLDANALLYMLEHGEACALIVDTEFEEIAHSVSIAMPDLQIVFVADVKLADLKRFPQAIEYETFLSEGDPNFEWCPPQDDWTAIALNYTSGTTGRPKGVVYHHRGAYLNALSNILEWDMPKHSVYLWTLPLFHCNGWCFAWTIAARAGVNVCLRKFDPKAVFDLIRSERVTHLCGAPIVQSALANAPQEWRQGINNVVESMVAGAAPAPSIIAKMDEIGFRLTHTYGLTEVYGPSAVCAPQQDWAGLDADELAKKIAHQGVRYHLQSAVTVKDPTTLQQVPNDGTTIGEIMFRGNICMKGYLKNEAATKDSFRGGWFHTGDLGVLMPNGYIRILDRSKDIIISGGENISSIEIEDALYRHPSVAIAAVVAMPDSKWGEVPCAFVELRDGAEASADEIVAHCRRYMAGFKIPKTVIFGELPKTSTGKVQKFELRKKVDSASAISFEDIPNHQTSALTAS